MNLALGGSSAVQKPFDMLCHIRQILPDHHERSPMASTRIFVSQSVSEPVNADELCFQRCTYLYDNGTKDDGLRFIYRREGRLIAHRGQARIPSKQILLSLIDKAEKAGMLT
jgi:hypothetical protein